MWLPLLLLACRDPDCPAGSALADDGLCHLLAGEDDSGGAGDGAAAPTPTWSAAAAGEAATAALALGLPEPVSIRDAYASLLTHVDGDCPMREDREHVLLNGVWYDDCYSAEGYHYDGLGIFEESRGDGAWAFSGVANFTITDPAGAVFAGGGEFALDAADDGQALTWRSKTGGVYHRDDDQTWLGSAGEAGLFAEGRRAGEARRLLLDGGAGYTGVDLGFSGLVVDTTVCGGDPIGELQIRDPSGHWFRVDFADCGGCGAVDFHGTPNGELCLGDAVRDAALALIDGQGAP